MQTQHTVLKRGGLFWNRDMLPPALFQERLGQVQRAIADAGDGAWLVYGDALRYGSLAYATHFLPRTRSALALIPREGEPSLLASVGSRDVPAAKMLTWIEDVRPFTVLPGEAIRLVQDRGFASARVGLVGARDGLPVTDWTAIREGLPDVQWRDRDEQLDALRMRKSDTEHAVIAFTAKLVRDGLERATSALEPGRTVRQAMADVDREIRRQGAEDIRLLVASGEQIGLSLRPPDDRTLAAGDSVLLFVAAEYQRYWAEAAQTFVLGPASSDQRALAQTAAESVEAMGRAARAGATADQVARAAAERIGGGDLLRSAEAYGLGHGIGLDPEEAPSIAAGNAQTLEDGAVLALHVVLHSGGLGAAFGETVRVTPAGAVALEQPTPLAERPG